MQILYQFRIDFWMDFDRIWAPKWKEIWSQIRSFLIIVFDVDPEGLLKRFFDNFVSMVVLRRCHLDAEPCVFYIFLIWQLCKKALQSDADDFKDRLEN